MITKFFWRILDYTEEIFIGISMFIMIAINFGNIVARYVFSVSWAFSEEILIILFVYNSLLGASMAFKRKKHTGFTALADKLPKKWQKIFKILVSIGIVVMMVILFYYGTKMCLNQAKYELKTSALGIPEYLAGASIPISALMIVIRMIQNLTQELRSS